MSARGYYLSKKSLQNISGVDPRLIEISKLAITLTLVDYGHDKYAGKRTAETQYELFRKGKSRADGTIIKSYHQTGKAIDFYAYVDGRATWEPKYMAMVATAFLQAASILGYPVEWGGLWSKKGKIDIYGWDMPHIQLLDED